MIKIITGDLLLATENILCHQVNCRNVMGSGVAKALYTKWPEVKREYHKFCETVSDPYKLLGQIHEVQVNDGQKVVINIFGQLNYGRQNGITYTVYQALEKAFEKLNYTYRGETIAFPYGFGCGLAGGDWSTVEKLMLTTLNDVDITIYMKGADKYEPMG